MPSRTLLKRLGMPSPATSPASPTTVPAARSRGLHGWTGFAFVVPYLVLLVAFGILPMLYALELAFTKESGGWAGLSNFTDTARDYRFKPALVHVLLYTSVWLTLLIVFVVTLALLLHGRA